MKLISHINGDSDIIEAWVKYYIKLGVDHFHLVVHGTTDQNETLLSIANQYPITIEEMYGGPFACEEKKSRLDAILSRCAGQWVVLADSDEFVEFPYENITATIGALTEANATVMAAPMLQRLTADGTLETPPLIEDPFELFPLCSVTLYRQMGMKGDIFKFPLFFCGQGTSLREEGNHHPPVGYEPRGGGIAGVTHHFKFRRTIAKRIDNMILSEHPWRHESVQFREYLDRHAGRLPLDNAFVYSREELFRRGLLRKGSAGESRRVVWEDSGSHLGSEGVEEPHDGIAFKSTGKKIAFILPKTTEFGGLERHLLMLIRSLSGRVQSPVIVCLDHDAVSEHLDGDLREKIVVKCVAQPNSLIEWLRLLRKVKPDIAVFCYNWFRTFAWEAPVASLLAGVKRVISIQHLVAVPPPAPPEGKSIRDRVRRLVGGRARDMARVRVTSYVSHRTICVSEAVRRSLVQDYAFSARRTITIHNGISTKKFSPSSCRRGKVREQFGIGDDDFVVVCSARLTEAKGVGILIYAVSRVVRQGIQCKCIIVGDGPLREKLESEVKALGLFDYIFFAGFQEDVRPFLQAGSSFMLTSYIEGLPLSILEAMSCGLPCIVTDVGGNAEAVVHGVTGLLISPGSLDEAERALLHLATHPKESAEMGERGREMACRMFDSDKQLEELRGVVLGDS